MADDPVPGDPSTDPHTAAAPGAASVPSTPPAADASASLGQDSIDELLKQANFEDPSQIADANVTPEGVASPVMDAGSAASPAAASSSLGQDSIDELLRQANFEDPAAFDPSAISTPADSGSDSGFPPMTAMPDTDQFQLPNFQQVMRDAQVSSIDLLRDVELNVKIELGRSRMLVEDVLKLAEGSVVELDKLAGDPVDVFVNDRLVARGEVLVLNDNFCVRVNEIVAGAKEEGI